MKIQISQQFGRLTAVRPSGKCKQGVVWFCLCECGKTIEVVGAQLNRGRTRSCGCLRSDTVRAKNRSHGMSRSKAYDAWIKLRGRCLNPKNAAYDRYGGRGITVCDRWESFDAFYEDMGEPPSRLHSVDRIDNELGYSPGNCRWATDEQQANNTRRNLYLTRDGVTMTLSQWCRALGVSYGAVRQRMHRGMSQEDALTSPFREARPIR